MNNELFELTSKAVRLLNENNMTVSTAESCTGGLLSAYITAVPGSSSVFEMGITSYSCRIKHEQLSVNETTLSKYGAVSFDTAKEMAENIKIKSDADIGLSVTGVAGPDGSEGHNPGLVYIAVAYNGGITIKELNIDPLSRNYVREKAVFNIIDLLIKTIGEVKHESRKGK